MNGQKRLQINNKVAESNRLVALGEAYLKVGQQLIIQAHRAVIILGELRHAPREELFVLLKISVPNVPGGSKEAGIAYSFSNLLGIIAKIDLYSHTAGFNVNTAIQKSIYM